MTDAPRLADHQIRSGQRTVDPVEAFLQPAIVVQKAAALGFDLPAIRVYGPLTPTDTENALARELFRLGSGG